MIECPNSGEFGYCLANAFECVNDGVGERLAQELEPTGLPNGNVRAHIPLPGLLCFLLQSTTLPLGAHRTPSAGLHGPHGQLLKLVVVASTEDLVHQLPEVVALDRAG